MRRGGAYKVHNEQGKDTSPCFCKQKDDFSREIVVVIQFILMLLILCLQGRGKQLQYPLLE